MPTKRAVYEIAEFKALPSEDEQRGKFEALVSVFGNVDVQGDRVLEGAFAKSLSELRAAGHPLPIIWSHNWGDPNAHIGSANPDDVEEVAGRGLKVAGSIDLDNPFAAQVYRLLKERRVREFSFGYQVRKERKGKDGANELVDLGLIEAGPTLKGANPGTELLAIKSDLEEAAGQKTPPWHIATDVEDCDGFAVVADETGKTVGCHETREAAERHMAALYANVEDASDKSFKAGRALSAKNAARLRSAIDAIEEVLASAGDANEQTETASKDDDLQGKSDESAVDAETLDLHARILAAKP